MKKNKNKQIIPLIILFIPLLAFFGLDKIYMFAIMDSISLVNNKRVSTHKADARFLLENYEKNQTYTGKIRDRG